MSMNKVSKNRVTAKSIDDSPPPEEELSEEEIARREKMRTKRKNVAKELLLTEETYVKNLEDLMRVFHEPMAENCKLSVEEGRVISTDEVKQIFGNLKVILGYNKMLLEDLKAHIEVDADTQILVGSVFTKMAVFLKSYTAYCNDYERSLEILRRLREKQEFIKFYQSIHDKSIVGDQDIKQFLILPVQRIPRYRMMLEEIRKSTWESHPDYEEVKQALQSISDIANFVEASQERFFNMNKIIEIQNKLKSSRKSMPGKLLEADRVLLEQAELKVKESTLGATGNEEQSRKREVIVFNDILLLAKKTVEKSKDSKKTDTLKLRKYLSMASCVMVTTVNQEGVPAVALTMDDGGVYTFYFANEDERGKWQKMLEGCQKQSKKKEQLRKASSSREETPDSTPRTPKKKRAKHLHRTLPTESAPQEAVTVFVNPLMQMKGRNLERLERTRKRSSTMALTAISDPDAAVKLHLRACGIEAVKKSPSMNSLSSADGNAVSIQTPSSPLGGHPLKQAHSRENMETVESEDNSASATDSNEKDSTAEKRSQMKRSPSVGSLGSLQTAERRKRTIPKFL